MSHNFLQVHDCRGVMAHNFHPWLELPTNEVEILEIIATIHPSAVV